MSEFFEAREQEYREAVARQDAERRKEARANLARVKEASNKTMAALIETFPPPFETPAEDTRPLRDAVAEHFQMTPGQRERLRVERHHARKAAQEAAAPKQQRGQSNELDLDGLVNPPELDWDAIEADDSDEYYDED